ncbi:hypothetical protein TEQG_07429 [Trichophyton equinum CBS 127.97]|uniref:Uncharacterized protein n=1 Tax=Trichophyton equinum (strain ATCC MYA-4606 / CBS 127.97) TaxID=559882 RepID=F2Q2X8_TRIEC|nr:hypothetical protein TEQG_07429 [Trichophyton equinum CBS 127.97]
MGRKIDPEERARRLQKRGFNPDKGSLSRERSNGAKDDDIFKQETIKHFIIYMAAGVEGQKDGKPMDSGILRMWKSFTGEWRWRKGVELPSTVVNSGVYWIKTEGELDVYLSSLLKVYIYSFGRVGEFIESSARTGSNRGLFIKKNITFLVIRNHKGMPELIFTPRYDAKAHGIRCRGILARFPSI